MDQKIKHIDFTDTMIVTTTTDGRTYQRPLSAFPLLLNANPSVRLQYRIGKFGDDVRWESIDEDIHIASLTGQRAITA